jgi:hypothetical protein
MKPFLSENIDTKVDERQENNKICVLLQMFLLEIKTTH